VRVDGHCALGVDCVDLAGAAAIRDLLVIGGEFLDRATVVQVPTRQASTAADDVGPEDEVEDPPQATSRTLADPTSAIVSLATIAARAC
jgi:hypothetical protein